MSKLVIDGTRADEHHLLTSPMRSDSAHALSRKSTGSRPGPRHFFFFSFCVRDYRPIGVQPNGGFFGQPDATISTFRRRTYRLWARMHIAMHIYKFPTHHTACENFVSAVQPIHSKWIGGKIIFFFSLPTICHTLPGS